MMAIAVEIFPEEEGRLIKAANLVGEKTWQYGLLLKGNSLCHGISGNGYLLFSLSRMYEFLSSEENKDAIRKANLYSSMRKWRTRAFMFATALDDPKV